MNELNEMIQRYAQWEAVCERASARGLTPPPGVVDEMRRIYSKAEAMLSPMEAQQALRAVAVLKAEHHQTMDTLDAKQEAKTSLYHADKLSRELSGLDSGYQMAAAKGETFTLPTKTRKASEIKSDIEQALKSHGIDMSYNEWKNLSTSYEEAKAKGRDDTLLSRKFGGNASQVGQMLDSFNKSDVWLRIGVQERMGDPEPETVESHDHNQRRHQIVEAAVDTALKDSGTLDAFSKDIPDHLLEEDSQRGDIARIMDGMEKAEDERNIETYDLGFNHAAA